LQTPLTAIDAARRIRDGQLSSVDLVGDCLARIEATDAQIGAWVHLDRDHALAQAQELDAIRRAGRPLGALHGVPVGLKDIIDTIDYPAERGSPAFAGRRPDADSAVAERLREAGAVILGKTVTTELAFLHPSETRNPHDLSRTPGGSSSGSAAAVAAGHVPLAIGTQTNGSVIRPAAFCGIFGFKPTRGVISRRGILQTSETLDQAGVFARTLEDAAFLSDTIAGYDPRDGSSYPRPRPKMFEGARADVPVEPVFAWFDLPFNDRLDPDARAGLEEVLDALGGRVERLPVSDNLSALVEVQRIIHEYEICQHLSETFDTHWEQISPTLKPVVERGRKIGADQHREALEVMTSAIAYFDGFFKDFDAVITPACAGEAPAFESGTGDPVFCTIWTLLGLPALTLPLLSGEHGLPVGVQLVGAAEEDDRLMRTAHWLINELDASDA